MELLRRPEVIVYDIGGHIFFDENSVSIYLFTLPKFNLWKTRDIMPLKHVKTFPLGSWSNKELLFFVMKLKMLF